MPVAAPLTVERWAPVVPAADEAGGEGFGVLVVLLAVEDPQAATAIIKPTAARNSVSLGKSP